MDHDDVMSKHEQVFVLFVLTFVQNTVDLLVYGE